MGPLRIRCWPLRRRLVSQPLLLRRYAFPASVLALGLAYGRTVCPACARWFVLNQIKFDEVVASITVGIVDRVDARGVLRI